MKKTNFTSRQSLLRQGIAAAAVAVCSGASMPASAGLLIQLPVQAAPTQDASFSQSRVIELDRARRALDLNSRLTANINQEGAPPPELPPIRGMGVDVTLADALRQIIPGGWKVFTEGEVPDDTIVSWQGNRTWPMALNTVLIPSNLKAVVDWTRNEVTLSSMKPVAKPAPKPVPAPSALAAALAVPASPAPAAAAAAPQATPLPAPAMPAVSVASAHTPAPATPAPAPVVNVINQIDESRIATMVAEKLKKEAATSRTASPAALPPATQAAAPAASPAPAEPPQAPVAITQRIDPAVAAAAHSKPAVSKSKWRLSKDKFLRENLREWAESEGWELQWDAVVGDRVINYPVNADAVLEGNLIGAGGVIDRVIAKFERADEPLGVRFYRGNKVVVVFLYSANTSTFVKQPNQTAE